MHKAQHYIIIPLLLIFTTIFSFSEEVEDNVNKYKSDNQPVYTKGNHTMECPTVKDDFITRVERYDFSAGKTYCKVYVIDPETRIPSDTPQPEIIDNYNPYAKDYYNTPTAGDKASIDRAMESKWKALGKEISSSPDLQKLKDKYFKNYVNTGNQEFLTSSKYLLAGLTMDGEIVNIKKSIEENDVVLNSGYTIYPNASAGGGIKKSGFLEKIWNWITSSEPNKNSNTFKSDEIGKLQSQARQMLSNIIVFVIDFFSELNKVYQDINFMVMALAVPITAIFAFQSKLTKKISKLHDHDDMIERSFLAIFIIFFFYIGGTSYKINDDKALDQTHFQNMSRWMMYKGVDWADDATRSMAKSYLSFKMKDAGIIGQEQSKRLEYENKTIDYKKNDILSVIRGSCYEYYDVPKIKKELGVNSGINQQFSSSSNSADYAYLKKDYADLVFTEEEGTTAKEIPTMHSCYQLIRDYQLLNDRKLQNTTKLEDYNKVLQSDGIKNRMNLVAEYIFKGVADNGFISAPLIGSTNLFLDGVEAFMTEEKKKLKDADKPEALSEYLKPDNLFGTSTLSWITDKSVYMMIAGASSVRETVYSLLSNDEDGFVKQSSKVILSLAITIFMIMGVVKYAPLLAMISASILVVVFYYISVEIFYLVTPFVVAYAFSTNQQHIIISLLSRYMALSLKPVMIVISIVLAMLAIKLFDGINTSMVETNIDMFQQVLKINNDTGNWWDQIRNWAGDSFNILGITFVGSIAKLLVQIFATFGVFYIVFNGADMMLKLFGFKEGGIDVQEGIGREIEGGAGKYSRPV